MRRLFSADKKARSELGKGFSSRSVALPQSKRLKMTPYSAERDIEGIPNCEARSRSFIKDLA